MRILLDTTILVRANESSHGLARELLLTIVTGSHTLVLSNEILFELARVLRYPRLQQHYRLSKDRVYAYIGFLREASEIVRLDPLLTVPMRDVNDIVVMQTALIGGADVLCTTDDDFFGTPARPFLENIGITVMDDIALMKRLRVTYCG